MRRDIADFSNNGDKNGYLYDRIAAVRNFCRNAPLSSRKLSAEELLHHARMEWTVETMHWLLDVHYAEDYCRIENKTLQQNFNLLRKFCISLFKQYQARINSKRAMSKIMLDCLLNPSVLLTILEN